MRTDTEMLELILKTARDDARVRAVMLNGSRANPNATRDIFQDFDIVYLVTELESFKANPAWIDLFGERMVMQCPDDFETELPPDRYGYLLQFKDGHRIDLTLRTGAFTADSLSVLLLDKDGQVAPPFPPSEADYLSRPPTPKAFFECCNEFWWVAPYVAKGLWRSELIYAQQHMAVLRDQLIRMLEWRLGMDNGFQRSSGKLGKFFPQRLSAQRWALFCATYADADFDRMWEAVFALLELFRVVALEVAGHFEFNYPSDEDQNVTAHLRHVRDLPKDAASIYEGS